MFHTLAATNTSSRSNGAPADAIRPGSAGGGDMIGTYCRMSMESVGWPASRDVVGDRGLSAVHPDRRGPPVVADGRGGAPGRLVPGHAEGKVAAVAYRGPGDLVGEVAHIATHPGPGGDPGRFQGGHATLDQPGGTGARVLVAGSRSAAVTRPASAQVATCGRPTRAPL